MAIRLLRELISNINRKLKKEGFVQHQISFFEKSNKVANVKKVICGEHQNETGQGLVPAFSDPIRDCCQSA